MRGHDVGDLCFVGAQVAHLDTFETADLIDEAGNLDRTCVIRRQRRKERLDERAVVVDQLALRLSHFGVTEDIERCPAKTLQWFERGDRWLQPRRELDLLVHADRTEHGRLKVPRHRFDR